MWKKLFPILLLGCILYTCKDENPYFNQCQDGPIKFELFNDELNPKVSFKDLSSFDTQYKIIQSERQMYQDLEILYFRNKIDFTTKSLIVISIKLNTYAQVLSQNIIAHCPSNKFAISAELRYGSQPREGISYVLAIIPKVSSDTRIEFLPTFTR